MRQLLRTEQLDLQPGYNIARCYLQAFGIALTHDELPWLNVPVPRYYARVIINRSARYHNPTFRWDLVLQAYKGEIAFIGHPLEHAAFTTQWGRVPYLATTDLLDAASVIAGAKLFIGNQSCCYAIAEALKVPAILETCPSGSNTLFDRPTVVRGVTANTVLPAIDTPRPHRLPGKPLVLRGPVDSFSGFGWLLETLTLGLAERGHHVVVAPTHRERTSFQSDIPRIKPAYEKLLVDADTPGHVIVSMHCGLPNLVQRGESVFTMWESTRIKPSVCDTINKAVHLMVPSCWSASTFNACGVNTPTSIVPLGIDTSVYTPRPMPPLSPFVFGAAGRVAHGGCRKGLDDVITAFLLAFPTDKDVRLHIKCFTDCKFGVSTRDPRIVLDRTFHPDLSSWYAKLHCFVSASRAEGWGLHLHQAMATGRPVLFPHFGATQEFLDDSCGWSYNYTLAPAREYYEGHGLWAEPDVQALAYRMKHARCEPSELNLKGQAAATRAARFSIGRMLNRFEDVLKGINLI
jgi:glycosyltransferase involved in cell wall biosynthesis